MNNFNIDAKQWQTSSSPHHEIVKQRKKKHTETFVVIHTRTFYIGKLSDKDVFI